MMIKKIWAASFSPTGGTEHIVSLLAEEMGKCLKLPVHKISFTLPDERKKSCTFTEEDLLILGTPVYAGRIPNKILPDVDRSFEGNGTLAVAARHAFSDDIGAGRPDKQDEEELRVFARKAAEKIREFSGEEKIVSGNKAACGVSALQITGHNPVGPYYTPLRADGQPAKFLKAKPVTDENLCNRCGTCAQVCPMGSISREDPSVVNGICIKCQACIRSCPAQAKHFEDEDFLSHVEMLREHYTRRAANAFFL